MTAKNTRTIKFYAYKISTNNSLTYDATDITKLLKDSVNGTTAEDRLLRPAKSSPDEDLLADYDPEYNGGIFYGLLMRVTDGVLTGAIPSEFLQNEKIRIEELGHDGVGNKRYKGVYYFGIKGNICIATTDKVKSLSVYLNWLIESVRGDTLFDFEALLSPSGKIKLSEVKSVELGGSISIPIDDSSSKSSTFTVKDVGMKLVRGLASVWKSPVLDQILENDLIHAKLVLQLVRPKDMKKPDYTRLISSIVTTGQDDVTFKTKNGRSITGETCRTLKTVEIELTSDGQISQIELKQEMERFFKELHNDGTFT